jgi:hypothetical protein
MIDVLLYNYGLLARNKRRNFKQKLLMLDRSGLISLRIFRRLNVERNAMEHDYRVPSSERVSDAIDVCQLMLLAVERLCQEVPYEGIVGLRDSGKHYFFQLEETSGSIVLTDILDPRTEISESLGAEFVPPLIGVDGSRAPAPEKLSETPTRISLDFKSLDSWAPYVETIAGLRTAFTEKMVTDGGRTLVKVSKLVPARDVDVTLGEFMAWVPRFRSDNSVESEG